MKKSRLTTQSSAELEAWLRIPPSNRAVAQVPWVPPAVGANADADRSLRQGHATQRPGSVLPPNPEPTGEQTVTLTMDQLTEILDRRNPARPAAQTPPAGTDPAAPSGGPNLRQGTVGDAIPAGTDTNALFQEWAQRQRELRA